MYRKRRPVEIQTPISLGPGRLQHVRFAARVIAQQYSSAIFVSLRLNFRKKI
jgi:hypothetical protein